MRFFQYSATDSTGRPTSGTIRAASADSARDALTQAGFRVSSVIDPGPQTAAQAARTDAAMRAAMAPRPIQPSRAQLSAATAATPAYSTGASIPHVGSESPVHIAINSPAVTSGPDPVKTKFSREKDLFFLFTQLGQYFRAGVSLPIGMHQLALKSPPRLQESLFEAEKAVAEGRSLSSVFERYPYLYPPDVVGALRAGEVSGSVGEACEQIADQKMTSHRLRAKLAYFLIIFVMILFAFPLSLTIVRGSLQTITDQDKAGGSLSPVGALTHDVGIEFAHAALWIIPLFVGIVAGLFVWHSMPMRKFRHRLVLMMPVLGGRVKAEAMARFTWALGMVSRGGTSPNQTFQLAAASVPNLILREQLMESAATMTESERLSSALRRSGTLPAEYSHIVETGETTGDVPRALADVNRATDADFRARDATASTLTGIYLYAAIGLLVMVLVIVLYRTFYGGVITRLTTDD